MRKNISGVTHKQSRNSLARVTPHHQAARAGFTIVELVVVIVVIGILAAISTAAYGGIQQRARNVQIVSGVNAYQKALISYGLVSGAYPTSFGACLGANYPSDQCWTGTNGTFNVSGSFDALLTPYLGTTKPTVSSRKLQVTSVDQRGGAIYFYDSPSSIRIVYYLEGAGQKCMDGSNGTNEMQATQCTLTLQPL